MEKAKLMKNLGIGLICLIVLVLLCFSIYQQRLIKNINSAETTETASKELAAVDTPGPEAGAVADKNASVPVAYRAQPDAADIDSLEAQLDAAESELDAAYEKLDNEMAKEEAYKEKQLELQRQYMQSPAFRNSIRSYLSTQYKELMEEMNLSEEEQAEFLDLLADQQTAYAEISPEIQTATTDAQKDDLRQRYADIREANKTAMEDLLGAEYETYHDYVEMQTSRTFIDGFSASLDAEDALTEEQEKELTEIMYKEQMQVFADMGYDPRYELEFPSDVKEGNVDGQAANMAKIHSKALKNSQGVLSESQFEQYESYLNNRQQIVELSEQMSD